VAGPARLERATPSFELGRSKAGIGQGTPDDFGCVIDLDAAATNGFSILE
jgi:hypothetical protein